MSQPTSELTITITIQVPDNHSDLNKLIDLLRHADYRVSEYASQEFNQSDKLMAELDSAIVPSQQTPDYKQRILKHYKNIHGYIQARDEVSKILFGAIHYLLQYRQEYLAEPTEKR